MTSFTLHLGRFSGCRQIWAFLFGALASQAMSPLFSEQCLACSDILQLGLGAHGWVSRICQPWEQSPTRSWLPIVEAPGCLRHQPPLCSFCLKSTFLKITRCRGERPIFFWIVMECFKGETTQRKVGSSKMVVSSFL